MATPVIPISSNSYEESVGSHVPRVILFGAIPAIFPIILEVPDEVPIVPADPLVALEVGAVSITSPTRVLDLMDYSSFNSDPSDDSLPPALELPLVSPFLCSDDSEADNKFESAKQRPERHKSLAVHDVMVSRLAWRRVSHRSSDHNSSPDFTSGSSSSGSSSDYSSDTSSGSPSNSLSDTSLVHSLGCDASGHTHSGPSTRVASSRSVPLSTLYPPTTSESSPNSFSERSLDSSSLFAGLSCKRCKSLTTSVPSSTPISRLIALTHADLLPPHKRFRDSYPPEDSREDHMKIGTTDVEAIADLGIGDGVEAHTEDSIGMRVEIAASDIREDEEEFEAEVSAGGTMEIAVDLLVTGGISESTRGDVPDLKDTLYDIIHYMSEVALDRITKFEIAQRQLEAD
ncbi:hypothetical protein Tco_0429151 [Tanacetum coccineum]